MMRNGWASQTRGRRRFIGFRGTAGSFNSVQLCAVSLTSPANTISGHHGFIVEYSFSERRRALRKLVYDVLCVTLDFLASRLDVPPQQQKRFRGWTRRPFALCTDDAKNTPKSFGLQQRKKR